MIIYDYLLFKFILNVLNHLLKYIYIYYYLVIQNLLEFIIIILINLLLKYLEIL